MIRKLDIVYVFLVTIQLLIKITTWAAVNTNWRNELLGARQTTSSALVEDDGFDGWQPIVQPQNWLITTSASLPLSLPSSHLGGSERISLMFERQQQQHQQYPLGRFYAYSHQNGNYTKKQNPPLPFHSQSKLDHAVQSTSNVKLKASNIDANPKANHNHENYRPLKVKKHYLLGQRPYTQIGEETILTKQAESRIDSNKNANRRSQDNTISPAMINSRLNHIPISTTTKYSFAVADANLIDSPSAAISSNKINDDNINEMLQPFHAALNKMKQFCDMLRDIMTDDRDDDSATADVSHKDLSNKRGANNDITYLNFVPLMTALKLLLTKSPITSAKYSITPSINEVHSYDKDNDLDGSSIPSTQQPFLSSKSSYASSTTVTEPLEKMASRGLHDEEERKLRRRTFKKKIKKKFKKYMFPLLIAYKLKFLAMIPLMIGGLTLLVGSTGLAGFFFAMFAAVMTIRSGHGRGGGRSSYVR